MVALCAKPRSKVPGSIRPRSSAASSISLTRRNISIEENHPPTLRNVLAHWRVVQATLTLLLSRSESSQYLVVKYVEAHSKDEMIRHAGMPQSTLSKNLKSMQLAPLTSTQPRRVPSEAPVGTTFRKTSEVASLALSGSCVASAAIVTATSVAFA